MFFFTRLTKDDNLHISSNNKKSHRRNIKSVIESKKIDNNITKI